MRRSSFKGQKNAPLLHLSKKIVDVLDLVVYNIFPSVTSDPTSTPLLIYLSMYNSNTITAITKSACANFAIGTSPALTHSPQKSPQKAPSSAPGRGGIHISRCRKLQASRPSSRSRPAASQSGCRAATTGPPSSSRARAPCPGVCSRSPSRRSTPAGGPAPRSHTHFDAQAAA